MFAIRPTDGRRRDAVGLVLPPAASPRRKWNRPGPLRTLIRVGRRHPVVCSLEVAQGRVGSRSWRTGDWPYKSCDDERPGLARELSNSLAFENHGTKRGLAVHGTAGFLGDSWLAHEHEPVLVFTVLAGSEPFELPVFTRKCQNEQRHDTL